MTETFSKNAWFPVAGSMVAVAWGGNEFTPLLVMYREQSHFSQVTVNGLLGRLRPRHRAGAAHLRSAFGLHWAPPHNVACCPLIAPRLILAIHRAE